MNDLVRIGLGGGCHWCTEAVFQSLKGVKKVDQGYISASNDTDTFFEGVIVHFNPEIINLEILIEIHLKTHQSAKNHSLRSRYLSAIYAFDKLQYAEAKNKLKRLSEQSLDFITQVHFLGEFKASREQITNYYKTDPERPFCKKYIVPKLELIQNDFVNYIK
ncbi:peptide-methionine (S)-S-oxide reductase [Gramella lutea]|uniref:peptide-methionine (S)-S-oxide reductase n=1 Tax=Christiangramia lutea TaxID=1607951 RepID=A0A9X2AB55_9FLAO|nr:peptide-methionine (S)-S-oxide reductase [Christiangramia lutea]MCH4823107.1 peptide-methionine (S)-S-oxide reductase [Christiangramia lutea]